MLRYYLMPERDALPAGEFASWLRQARDSLRSPGVGMNVPCGECIACCRASLFIHIRPGETQTLARIPKELLFPVPGLPKGHVLMGYNERGECPMLQDGRCSIYEHRPFTCREFDCRVLAAAGVELNEPAQAEIAARARRWKFEFGGDEARSESAAVRAAAKYLHENREHFPSGSLPANPTQLAALAIKVYEVFVGSLRDESDPHDNRPPTAHPQIVHAILATLESFEAGTPAA